MPGVAVGDVAHAKFVMQRELLLERFAQDIVIIDDEDLLVSVPMPRCRHCLILYRC